MINPRDEFELEFWRECNREQYANFTYPKILQLWTFENAGAILEMGTGPLGGLLPYLEGSLKIGVDPLFQQYRESGLLLYPPNVYYVQGLAENVSFSRKFNTIISVNALDHGDSDFHSLINFSTLLEDDGRIFLHVHLRESHQLNIGHDHQLKIEDFCVAVKGGGLQVIDVDIYESDPLEPGSPYKTLMAILGKS